MRESFNENKTLVILFIILGFVVLGALYYYVVYPKLERSNQVANSIQSLTVETRQLEADIAAFYEESDEEVNTFELRKKLPETRAVSELLRSLQEAEYVSAANIQSITFNNYDALVSESTYGEVDEEERTDDDIDEINRVQKERQEKEGLASDEEDEEDVPETHIDVTSLPTALKLLSFSVQVEVQDYDHLLDFIREIESIERIKRIENIVFSQGGEAELQVEKPDETIVVTLQVTTFYSEEEAD